MGITDELRHEVADYPFRDNRDFALFEAVADRIDAEHQKAKEEWLVKNGDMWLKGYNVCHKELMEGHPVIAADLEKAGWVRLPVDADGVPIRIGDVMVLQHEVKEKPDVVQTLTWDGEDWYFTSSEGFFNVCGWEHYHAPTVEDILREIVHKCQPTYSKDGSYTTGLTEEEFAEYAVKLRLADDGEEQ